MEYTPPLCHSDTTFELDPAANLSDRPTMWALPELFPCHRLSLVVAPSGTGLTQFACHLAALAAPACTPFVDPKALPAAEPQPEADPSSQAPSTRNQAPPTSLHDSIYPSVLLVTDRDQPGDTLKPRLQALGADLQRILVLSKVYHHHPSPDGWTPPSDTAEPLSPQDNNQLAETLHEHSTIRLVLIDNAELLFSHSDRPGRAKLLRDLALLQNVAQRRFVAIVLLTSIPSLSPRPFRSTLLASLQECARMVYLLAPDRENPSAHLLFTLKNTLHATTPSVPARRLHLVAPPQSQPMESLPLSYPQYLEQRTPASRRGPAPLAHDYAAEVLTHLLAAGPCRVGHPDAPDPETLYHQTQAAAVNWHTVQRAKRTLQITSYKEGEHWYWRLPSTLATRPEVPLPSDLAIPDTKPTHSVGGTTPTPPTAGDLASASRTQPSPDSSLVTHHSSRPSDETCLSSPADPAQPLTPPAPAPTPHTLQQLANLPSSGPSDLAAAQNPSPANDAPSRYGIINNHYPNHYPSPHASGTTDHTPLPSPPAPPPCITNNAGYTSSVP